MIVVSFDERSFGFQGKGDLLLTKAPIHEKSNAPQAAFFR
jgi:hypothetical protein